MNIFIFIFIFFVSDFLERFFSLLSPSRRHAIGLSLLVLIFAPLTAMAKGGGGTPATCTFSQTISLDWDTAGNWDCGHIPLSIDTAVIPALKSAESSGMADVAATLQIANTGSLTVSGGTLAIGNQTTNAGTLTITGGVMTLGGSGPTNQATGLIQLNGGTMSSTLSSINNLGTIQGSGVGTILTTIGLVNSGTVNHTGFRLSIGSGGFLNTGTYSSDGTATIAFSSPITGVPDLLYPSVELGGTITFVDNSYVRSQANITVLSGATITSNSSTFVVPENWEVQSGGSFVGYGSTVRFTGSNTSTITVPASGADFYTIEVTKDVGDVGVMLLSDATAAHALFLTQGIFDLNGFVLSLPGVCTFTGGGGTTDWGTTTNWDCDGSPRLPVAIDFAHIPSPQTVVVAGTGGPMDAHMPVGSLTVDNGATLQLSGALDVSGTSTNAGTISLSTGTMNFSGGAAATFVNTGSIVSTLAGTLRVDALFTNSGSVDFSVGGTLRLMRAFSGGGSLDLSGATLILDGDGYQLPTAATLIENLTVSSGLSTAVGYIQADTTITGVLTLETFIDLQSNTLTLSGSGSIVSSVDSNGNFYTNTGTLRFTGSGDQTITAPWTLSYLPLRFPAVVVDKTGGSVSQGSVISHNS
jgi:hypothetical protein